MQIVNDTTHRILDTAARLFVERGYELVGVNEIIEKSDVAKATFYSHFKSKEKLCVAWLDYAKTEAAAEIQELLASPLSPREKVAQRFDELGEYLVGSGFRGCPFSNTAAMVPEDNEIREAVRAYKAGSREGWRAIARQFGRSPEASDTLGDAIFLLFSGSITEGQNARNRWPIDAAKVAALSLCDRA